MGRPRNLAAAAVIAVAAACGSGGGGGAGSGNAESTYGVVRLLSHSPADGAVQVAVDAPVFLEFDAPIALESLGDVDTWLRPKGSTENVPGTFSRGAAGRVVFTPQQSLELERDYEFQLSALTSDQTGRILDLTRTFSFRTFDETPPQLVSVDVAHNSTNVSRTRAFAFTFSEDIKPGSVADTTLFLRDKFGIRYAAERTVAGPIVTLRPLADLPGDRQFLLIATEGIADRAGNQLGETSLTQFFTAIDTAPPHVVATWPPTGRNGISPRIQPTFTFDESMDPATVEPASLLFQDQFGSVVPYSIASSADQRTLRIVPAGELRPGRTYTIAFLLGPAAATDTSGNVLESTQALSFQTGDDTTPPAFASTSPTQGETRVPGTVDVEMTFAEDLDADWIGEATVTVSVDGTPRDCVVEMPAANTVRVTPLPALPIQSACTVRLLGGHDGVRDLAGNVLPQDLTLTFTTSADAGLPRVIQLPPDGSTGIATSSHVSFVFDAPMDPATLNAATLRVFDDSLNPIAGSLSIAGGNRVVKFTPATPFAVSTYYRTRVVGGSLGARRQSGNWFDGDQNARFRTTTGIDTIPPSVSVTLNGIQSTRNSGLFVPPYGFAIDVAVTDAGSQWADMGSIEVMLQGGQGPGAASLQAIATVGYGTFSVTVPPNLALSAGEWTLQATGKDLSGNSGTSNLMQFTVADPDGGMLPFERTQVVWVRTDLSRDTNTLADFDDDMLRLGFNTAGDPIGTNARMRDLVLDGILAQCNRLYGRGTRGEPIDGNSVGVRFTKRQPIAVAHMQMSLGGLDPTGNKQRAYGEESTGVLGRAYYDYRNGNPSELNISANPGLGVFPAEMWLYQTRIHEQVWPSYLTTFAQRFRPLCPQMGGTPAGADPLDPIVLAPQFVYDTATAPQRARWLTIMEAADDWATVMGIILAHEVGHSVGLVAPGPSPNGLFGDSSLHNTYASAAEVMSSSVGYEAMTSLEYHFRDIDLAYLRQRVLLR